MTGKASKQQFQGVSSDVIIAWGYYKGLMIRSSGRYAQEIMTREAITIGMTIIITLSPKAKRENAAPVRSKIIPA